MDARIYNHQIATLMSKGRWQHLVPAPAVYNSIANLLTPGTVQCSVLALPLSPLAELLSELGY